MNMNFETRGKLAVIQDQLDGVREAYRTGAMEDAVTILRSIPPMIDDLLKREPKIGG